MGGSEKKTIVEDEEECKDKYDSVYKMRMWKEKKREIEVGSVHNT